MTVDTPNSSTSFDASADQIWLYDTTTMDWVQYYYKHTGRGSTKKVIGWVKKSVDGTEETSDTMKNGDGFFFRRSVNGDGVITLSGAIKPTSADPVALTADRLHFLCNPWPVSITVKDFTDMISNPQSSTSCDSSADQIWLYDTTSMDWIKYYYKHTGRGSTKKVVGWVDASVDGTEETTDVISVGKAFFLKRSVNSDATITFVKPAGL